MSVVIDGTNGITFPDSTTQASAVSTPAAGAVGSYAFLSNLTGTATTFGSTEAGSNLRYFGIRDTQVNAAGNIRGSVGLSGTWMCLGQTNASVGGNTAGTIWLRIS